MGRPAPWEGRWENLFEDEVASLPHLLRGQSDSRNRKGKSGGGWDHSLLPSVKRSENTGRRGRWGLYRKREKRLSEEEGESRLTLTAGGEGGSNQSRLPGFLKEHEEEGQGGLRRGSIQNGTIPQLKVPILHLIGHPSLSYQPPPLE